MKRTKAGYTNAGYLGWTNFQTWLIALWISNNEEFYKFDAPKLLAAPSDEEAGYILQETFRAGVVNTGRALTSKAQGDLLQWALQEVNWTEIAASVREGKR